MKNHLMSFPGKAARRFIVGLSTILFLLSLGAGSGWSQAKLIKDAAPGSCKTCHGDGAVLSPNHPDTAAMNLKACKACHKDQIAEGKKPTTLSGRMSLSHAHGLAGKNCASCHGEELKAPAQGVCLQCHKGYGEKKNRLNASLPKVHNSHMGELSCDLCHKAHGKSVNFCAQCHDWKYIVP